MLSYCSDDDNVDFSILDSIRDELSLHWPSLKGGDAASFWDYEWRKHGTCARHTLALDGMQNFFRTTLELKKRLFLEDVLSSFDYLPGGLNRPYSAQNLINSLSQHYRARPIIKCSRQGRNRVLYLKNLSFCYDKELKMIDCPMNQKCSGEFILPLPN